MDLKLFLLLLAAVNLTQVSRSAQSLVSSYDVIVYTSTPAGVAAAIAAKQSGANSVLLLEPTAYVGGMASPGGIGLRDCEYDDIRDNNSTQHEWGMRNAEHYGVEGPVWQPDNWVGEKSFREMLSDYGVELRLSTNFVEGSAGVRMEVDSDGLCRITTILLESGESLEGRYFIDASYEGELMIATDQVEFTFGRESKEKYNESYGGVTSNSLSQFDVQVDPFLPDAQNKTELLKYVRFGTDPRSIVGEADSNVMAYSFRACLTNNPNNMVPISEPEGYNPKDFELSRRLNTDEKQAQKKLVLPWSNLDYMKYPSSVVKANKYDACCGDAPVGIDAVGLAVEYVNASRTQRKQSYDSHKYYVQGLMWFWVSDDSVPESVRTNIKSYGLCKDEWPENEHFPPQLYVREAARIVGDKVFNQNDKHPADKPGGCLNDSIAISDWGYDIHDMQRVAVIDQSTKKPFVFNEGLTSGSTGGSYVYELPYYIMLPKKAEMVNLAVPNCPSVSHVTFSSIRVEPTLWQIGQAAGTAAGVGVAIGGSMALQDIPVDMIQEALLKQGAFIHWPPKDKCND